MAETQSDSARRRNTDDAGALSGRIVPHGIRDFCGFVTRGNFGPSDEDSGLALRKGCPAEIRAFWKKTIPKTVRFSADRGFADSLYAGAVGAGTEKSMNKQDIYRFLDEKGISYEVTEHEAVFNMEELGRIDIPYPEADAKNLFVRDDRKRMYCLITVRGDKRVDLKEFRKQHGTRPLSFASPQELWDMMQLIPGSVTPLGILNDREKRVQVWIDADFLKGSGLIGVHPNDNTATVWLKTADLLGVIREHGNPVETVPL